MGGVRAYGIKVAENSCNWLPKALVDNGTTYNTMSGGEADTGGDKTVSFAPEEEKSAKVLQQKLSMLQKQHELQSVSNSLSFPKPVTRLVFWTRPKQRQRWGDVDSHVSMFLSNPLLSTKALSDL